jgi:hypothetical protein
MVVINREYNASLAPLSKVSGQSHMTALQPGSLGRRA